MKTEPVGCSRAIHAGARCCNAGATLHDDSGFGERMEDLAIEQCVAQAGVEALDIAVLQR